ncbi:MAG: TetR/AcrR family transcriptional regulator [Verrucomicrobiota bacterium]
MLIYSLEEMETKQQIIRSALEVLKTQGTEGLTLRKVATHAQMSLGNLQYHYKNKSALFGGLAEHYFSECSEILRGYVPIGPESDLSTRLRHLIGSIFDHLDDLTDMCRIFRELWALATRDPEISFQLMDYYCVSRKEMEALFLEITSSPEGSSKIVTLLLPYFEGYSITHNAIEVRKDQVVDLLTELSMTLVD